MTRRHSPFLFIISILLSIVRQDDTAQVRCGLSGSRDILIFSCLCLSSIQLSFIYFKKTGHMCGTWGSFRSPNSLLFVVTKMGFLPIRPLGDSATCGRSNLISLCQRKGPKRCNTRSLTIFYKYFVFLLSNDKPFIIVHSHYYYYYYLPDIDSVCV